jgi:hypothetical protein
MIDVFFFRMKGQGVYNTWLKKKSIPDTPCFFYISEEK